MNTVQRTVAVGVFENHQRAQEAVQELRRAGFREDQIGVVSHGPKGEVVDTTGSKVAAGAATGLAAGAGLGALWGIGIVAGLLPAIGPAIAGGTLAAILSSAAAGAAVAGIAGALIGLGIPEEEARFYEEEFKAGRTIVTVKADSRYSDALSILRRFGAYDVSSRNEAGVGCSTATVGARSDEGGTIEVREEEMRVRKQPVTTGEVQVRKEVHTEHKTVEVPVKREEVVVERRPASGHATSTTPIREGEEIRVPVMEEQVHVEKHPVVKEEVVVGKRLVEETEQVSGTVRKEEVHIEKQGDAKVKNRNKK